MFNKLLCAFLGAAVIVILKKTANFPATLSELSVMANLPLIFLFPLGLLYRFGNTLYKDPFTTIGKGVAYAATIGALIGASIEVGRANAHGLSLEEFAHSLGSFFESAWWFAVIMMTSVLVALMIKWCMGYSEATR